jgi:adhesin transport system membrane fusion protein
VNKLEPEIIDLIARDERKAQFITTLLDQGRQTRLMRRTLLGIVLLLAIFIGWAIVTPVDELARARGEIQPSEHVQSLQSEEGGRIVKLLVHEGEQVKAGQPIVEFAATNLVKDVRQVDIKLNALSLDRERLKALLDKRVPDFSSFAEAYPLLTEQAQLTYQAQLQMHNAAILAKKGEMVQQSSLLQGGERGIALLTKELQETKERLARVEEGVRRGIMNKLSLSDARLQFTSVQERLNQAQSQQQSIKDQVNTLASELDKLESEFSQQVSAELGKITEAYREAQSDKQALEERKDFIVLESPVDGVVINIPETRIGAVVAAGGSVAEIVPVGQSVIMEAMVLPKDIGFVKVGQRAMVKVDSFDSARFGFIEGTVNRVAPTSSKLKENGMPYYKVQISLANPYVKSPEHTVIAGMTGEADIATGSKSVMQFLLKPLFLASDTAFHER